MQSLAYNLTLMLECGKQQLTKTFFLMTTNTRRASFERNELLCWCVVRYLLNFQSIVLAKFSSRAEAEVHLRFLKRAKPNVSYEVIFMDEYLTINDSKCSGRNVRNQNF